MKERVEKTVERGSVDPGYVTCEEEREIFEKWGSGFSRQEHPPIIQVRHLLKRMQIRCGNAALAENPDKGRSSLS